MINSKAKSQKENKLPQRSDCVHTLSFAIADPVAKIMLDKNKTFSIICAVNRPCLSNNQSVLSNSLGKGLFILSVL